MPDLHDYDYPLPPELVAQHPLPQRDASRLLVLERASGAMHHGHFRDLPHWLDSQDLLVVNDTRVFPARLVGRKASGGRVELLLHQLPQAAGDAGATVRATYRGRLKVGQTLHLGGALEAQVVGLVAPGVAEVRLAVPQGDATQAVLAAGQTPLPPYIRRPAEPQDRRDYQTMFAAHPGDIACPTAGLHFTPEALAALAAQGVETAAITLHVGPGTFMPVRQRDYTRHRILPEYFHLSPETAARLNAARKQGRRLAAVGTTSVRVLEYCLKEKGFAPQTGWCGLYIYPGYQFRAVDRLITNFHLPKSTLLLLVSAFAGRELILAAYGEAVRRQYRFYSYGDCMLIL